MANWQKFDLRKTWNLPTFSGCYVIYVEGTPAYVGSGVNVRNRVRSHCRLFPIINPSHVATPWGDFEDVCVKVRKSRRYGEWTMGELRLIKKLQPRFNKVSK